MHSPIQYVEQSKLDRARWDQCISLASNGLIYGYSYYLDHMARHWDALVMGDYEAVMPITWNKKWGIPYLYQPAFTASLGLIGSNISGDTVLDFIRAIPGRFKLIEIDLNHANNAAFPDGMAFTRTNYVLNLDKTYDELFKQFNENIRRNARRAVSLGCYVNKDISIEEVIKLSTTYLHKESNLKEEDYTRFRKLFDILKQRKQAALYGICAGNHQLVASAVFFYSHKRAYYILVGNHPDGKTMGASHFLIDRFIFDHAEQDLVLDFEGGDAHNLAFFYSSFGAKQESYPALRINRLPWWARLVK